MHVSGLNECNEVLQAEACSLRTEEGKGRNENENINSLQGAMPQEAAMAVLLSSGSSLFSPAVLSPSPVPLLLPALLPIPRCSTRKDCRIVSLYFSKKAETAVQDTKQSSA